jgi:methylphosphotriester-DNA--protein-cysteine methyltransferase
VSPIALDARSRDALCSLARSTLLGRSTDDPLALAEVYAHLAIEGRPRCDPRVLTALDALDAERAISDAASSVGLSPERLRHVARAELGVSLATWRLWHRTIRATTEVVRGRALARAAVDAGFSDHAHFTRSFVRFLGRTPSSMHGELAVLASYR